jgi:hypothetical protein
MAAAGNGQPRFRARCMTEARVLLSAADARVNRCPLSNQRPDTLIVFTSPFGRSAEHDLMPGDQTGNDHGCRGRYGADPYRYGGLDFRRFALTLIHEPQLQLR